MLRQRRAVNLESVTGADFIVESSTCGSSPDLVGEGVVNSIASLWQCRHGQEDYYKKGEDSRHDNDDLDLID